MSLTARGNSRPLTKINFPAFASKRSSVWLASFSLLVWPTTGSECNYWQTTSHIGTALGLTISLTKCVINTLFTVILLSQLTVRKRWAYNIKAFFFCWQVLLYCLEELLSCNQCWKHLEKTHRVILGISQTIWSFSAVHSATSTYYIYTLGHIAQTNFSALTTQSKRQHMRKTGSGATT